MGRAFTVHELQRPTNKIATAHEHFFCRYERIFSSFFLKTRTEREGMQRGERQGGSGQRSGAAAGGQVAQQQPDLEAAADKFVEQVRQSSRHHAVVFWCFGARERRSD